jgi:hypothetical protein
MLEGYTRIKEKDIVGVVQELHRNSLDPKPIVRPRCVSKVVMVVNQKISARRRESQADGSEIPEA